MSSNFLKLLHLRDIEIWDLETGTGRVDQGLSQAMRVRQTYTHIIKIERAACGGSI